jgi:large conductance mechanosensitive channel
VKHFVTYYAAEPLNAACRNAGKSKDRDDFSTYQAESGQNMSSIFDQLLKAHNMAFMSEFKAFAMKGNVVDLAVAVIIGAAFAKIVDSLVQDLIMPVVGKIFGGLDFSNYYIALNNQATGLPLVEAKKLGAVFAYGNFLTISVNFLILAFIIFQMVRMISRLQRTETPPAPVIAGPSEEVLLLTEIRNELQRRSV